MTLFDLTGKSALVTSALRGIDAGRASPLPKPGPTPSECPPAWTKSGKVIFTASPLTFQGGINMPGYAASKVGVGQLTMAFANEWAARGIQVYAIAPGYITTDNSRTLRNYPDRRPS